MTSENQLTTHQKVKQFLEQNKIQFTLTTHEETKTSEESAKVRGEPLRIGAKALLLKTKDEFVIAVMPADKNMDNKKMKKILKCSSLRFATPDELKSIANVEKGLDIENFS